MTFYAHSITLPPGFVLKSAIVEFVNINGVRDPKVPPSGEVTAVQAIDELGHVRSQVAWDTSGNILWESIQEQDAVQIEEIKRQMEPAFANSPAATG